MLIIVARGTIPDFWSIVVGNALLAAAYGILWCGARNNRWNQKARMAPSEPIKPGYKVLPMPR
jgi:hypothetical protein